MFVTVCDSTMYKLVPGSTDNSDVFVSWIEHPYVNGEKPQDSGGFTPSCPNEGTTNLFLNQREVSGSEKLLFHHRSADFLAF